MLKIADFTDDRSHKQLHRLSTLVQLPDYVKAATFPSPESLVSLPSHAFAYPATRKFPCHTKVAAYLSTLFYLDQRADLPKDLQDSIAERLVKSAEFWSISAPIKALFDTFDGMSKVAAEQLSDDDFAIVVKWSDGTQERKLPINTPNNVKAAAQYLRDNLAAYPYAWRKTAATRILDASARLDVELPESSEDYLRKAAALEPAHPKDIATAMYARAAALKDRQAALSTAVKLGAQAQQLRSLDAADHELALKMAAFLDDFDRQMGLTHRYGRDVPTPEQSCFGNYVKLARVVHDSLVPTTDGRAYLKDDLLRVGMEPYALVDSDLVGDLSDDGMTLNPEKVAEIVPTLPRDEACRLSKALAELGVMDKSARCKTLGHVSRMTKCDWMELANDVGWDLGETNFQLTLRRRPVQ